MAHIIPIHKSGAISDNAIISLEQVHLHYDKKCVLHNLDMSIPSASMTAIMGRNGAGKTTLLKAIMGIIPLSSGTIRINDAQNLKFGYLPQITDFDRDFPITVEQTIAMGAMGKKTGDIRQKITAALRDVGLDHMQKRLIGDLSAGQLKRVLFARLIVQDADIICLDEPFAEIDEQSASMLMRHLLAWKQLGKTIMVVLHNLEMARQYFDHAIILSTERGHKCGPTSSLLPEIIAMSAGYGD